MEIDLKNAIGRGSLICLARIITERIVSAPRQIAMQCVPAIGTVLSAAKDSIQAQPNKNNIYDFERPYERQILNASISFSKEEIMAAPSGLNCQPFEPLVNRPGRFNHADGNKWIHNEGTSVITCETTKRNLLVAGKAKDSHITFTNLPGSGARGGIIDASNHTLGIAANKIGIAQRDSAAGNCGEPARLKDMEVSLKKHVFKLMKAGRTLQDTLTATTTRALDSTFGHCVLNGDFLQGFIMLILFLPRAAITKRKAPGAVPSCSRNKSSIELSVSRNKSYSQKQ